MTYGEASRAMREGKHVTRESWLGNIHLFMEHGGRVMARVNGVVQSGWRASARHVSACDWKVVDGKLVEYLDNCSV